MANFFNWFGGNSTDSRLTKIEDEIADLKKSVALIPQSENEDKKADYITPQMFGAVGDGYFSKHKELRGD